MDTTCKKLKRLLNIKEKDKLDVDILNQITSIDVEKVQSLISQISNLREPPLIFVKMNSEFEEGEKISGRIICMDQNFFPINCKVKLINGNKTVFKGLTDNLGSLEFEFDAEYKFYEIKVKIDGKEKTLRLDLTRKEEEYICYMITDRDYYMPGQRILIRFILWKLLGSTYQPSQEPIKVTLTDPQNNRILIRKISCDSKFGIGELQIPIAEEAIEGVYKVKVSVKGFKSEKSIKIENYQPPDIELKVKCEPEYLKIGDEFRLELKSEYFYGAPVKKANAKIEIISPENKQILQTYGETDEKGEYIYRFQVPEMKEGESKIIFELTDSLKRKANKEIKISTVKQALIVTTDMARSIEPGQQAEVIIKTEVPTLENKKVPLNECFVLASINDTELKHHAKFKVAKTDNEGRCPLTFEIDYPTEKKKNFDINIMIESELLDESKTVRKGLTVEKAVIKEEKEQKEGEKENPKIWLNTNIESPSLNINDFLHLNAVVDRENIPIYVDIEKENIIYRTVKLATEGTADFKIPITRKMWGNLKVITYAFRSNGILEKNERKIYVNPERKELKIDIESDKSTYQPGNKANFQVKILQDDKAIACCLGAMLVDASVLQLGRKIETPLEIFFKKEFIKKNNSEILSWDTKEYGPYFNALLDALIHYIYLNPKLVGTGLEFLRITKKAGMIQDVNHRLVKRKIIELIQEIAEKNKEKNSKTLIYNILKIISESLILVNDNNILMIAAEDEISQIDDNNIDLYQEIVTDIHQLSKEGHITKEQEDECLINISERIFNTICTKDSPLTNEIKAVLNEMLIKSDSKRQIQKFIQKIDIKFKSLKKVKPKVYKDPKGNPICLELGSNFSYAGFAGEDGPRSVLPTIVGYPKYMSIMTDVEHYSREYYIGEEALMLRGGSFTKDYKRTIGITTSSGSGYGFYSVAGKSSGPSVVHRCFGGSSTPGAKLGLILTDSVNPISMVSVRFNFPETSLWIPFLESDGQSMLETELPDQITSHELTVFASTKDCEIGMGTHRITVKQDFFAKLDIPPVLTHGDNIQLGIILTNLTKENLECNVNLNADKYKLKVDIPKGNILVPANGMKRLDFKLKAINPGEATFWIEAKTPKHIDVLRKKIKINPKGEPHIFRYTGLILEDEIINISPTIPRDAIFYKARLSLIPGYQMGCMDGLESILGYPHGCVEQTMSKFLPNVLVYNLLKENNMLTNKFQEQFEEMTTKGIQQLISLRNDRGGWGYWGNEQSEPFTTAYVLFGLAYTINSGFFIEKKLINAAIEELKKIQTSQGTWESNRRGKDFCTAYVIQALLEAKKAGYNVNQEIIDKALENIISNAILSSKRTNDPNLLAYLIIDIIKEGSNKYNKELNLLIEKLNTSAHNEGDFVYWDVGSSLAGKVESTAYAALALNIAGGDPVNVQRVLNYIMANRAKGGGWSTTSDTIAAILCLSNCARSEKTNFLTQAIFNKQVIGEFEVNEDTLEHIVYDMRNIPLDNLNSENKLILEKNGEGLLVYDLTIEAWYPKEYLLKPKMLTITRDFSSNKVAQNDSISVKLNITTTEKQGMFAIEEPIPAGFLVVEQSLKKLVEEYQITSYKLTSDKLNLYLNELDGSITLTYNMTATKPGEIIVKETVGYPMYNVDLRANSSVNILQIE